MHVHNMYTVCVKVAAPVVYIIPCVLICMYIYDRASNYTNSYGFPGSNTDAQMQCSCILIQVNQKFLELKRDI